MKQIKQDKNTLTKEQRIQSLYESGITKGERIYRMIKSKTPCSKSTVFMIIAKLKNGQSLNRKERCNKNKSSLAKHKKAIQKLISSPDYIDFSIIKRKLRLKHAKQAIRNFIKQNNLASWNCVQQKPLLTQFQKSERVVYCKNHKNDNIKIAIFDDETKLETHLFKKKTWNPKNSAKKSFTKPKFPTKINVWGAISFYHKSKLCIFKETMDGQKYRKILTNYLFPFAEKCFPKMTPNFYSDNDPKHRANKTTQLIDSRKIKRMQWPSNSPDLNPIENVWNLVKEKIKKQHIKNEQTLKKMLRKAWQEIPQKKIQNLMNSWKNRCLSIIEAQGDVSKY